MTRRTRLRRLLAVVVCAAAATLDGLTATASAAATNSHYTSAHTAAAPAPATTAPATSPAMDATAGVASAASTNTPTVMNNNTTCYGGAVSVTLPPNGYSRDFTKNANCNDINLEITSGGGQWVAVCWVVQNNCQNHWTWVPQDGSFHVVATSVLNGTIFQFVTTNGGGTRQGLVAA
jgi:hypothetical protein